MPDLGLLVILDNTRFSTMNEASVRDREGAVKGGTQVQTVKKSASMIREYLMRLIMIGGWVVLTSCFASQDAIMVSWEGKSVDDVFVAWGPPDSTATLSNGNRAFTWIDVWSPIQGTGLTCRRTFTADKGGRITSWSNSGCPRGPLHRPFGSPGSLERAQEYDSKRVRESGEY